MKLKDFMQLYDDWKRFVKIIHKESGTEICTKIELIMLEDGAYHIPSIMDSEVRAFGFKNGILNVWI